VPEAQSPPSVQGFDDLHRYRYTDINWFDGVVVGALTIAFATGLATVGIASSGGSLMRVVKQYWLLFLISGLFSLFGLVLLTLTFEKRMKLESSYWFIFPIGSSLGGFIEILEIGMRPGPVAGELGGVGWPVVCFIAALSVVLIGVGIIIK
jgi:hypothetical protein